MNMKKIVSTPEAPKAIGPYSQAVVHDGIVYLSGQIAIDAATNQLIEGDVVAQTHRVLGNLKAVLEAAGSSLGAVLRTTVFLKDMADFSKMNAVYAEFFPENPPARSAVQVAALPKGGSIEIEAIALAK